MKVINSAFALAVITLFSANAFAAGAGETKDVPCQTSANKDGDKAQKSSNVQTDEAKKPKTETGTAK
jgi:hypothetical protein